MASLSEQQQQLGGKGEVGGEYRVTEARPPWGTIAWAVFLLLLGLLMFVCGLILWTVDSFKAGFALWLLGLLTFIPGFYYSRIAFYAYHKYEGFSFRNLPNYQCVREGWRPPGADDMALPSNQ